MATSIRRSVWIDLENTPHVPFFIPIARELNAHGIDVILTGRDFAQTKELIENAGLHATIVGSEYGASTWRKVAGLLTRAVRLWFILRRSHVSLAVGHGSRGLLIASKLLRVPSLILYDYEGANVRLFNRLATRVMTPEILSTEKLSAYGLDPEKHLTYPGLKEEVYLADAHPTGDVAKDLGLDMAKIVVVVRPPSDTAHYRAAESQQLFEGIMQLLTERSDLQIVLTPRTRTQLTSLGAQYPSVIIPERAVNGIGLLECADLVIGGGGTMNREAAAMGIPVLSIFKGEPGAVDERLIASKKMYEAHTPGDVLPLLSKRTGESKRSGSAVRDAIVAAILRLLPE